MLRSITFVTRRHAFEIGRVPLSPIRPIVRSDHDMEKPQFSGARDLPILSTANVAVWIAFAGTR